MKFYVEYRESERDYGFNIWETAYDSKEEAMAAVYSCNKDNPVDHVPDYYIVATYKGSGDA